MREFVGQQESSRRCAGVVAAVAKGEVAADGVREGVDRASGLGRACVIVDANT